jgi:hypothetical protein
LAISISRTTFLGTYLEKTEFDAQNLAQDSITSFGQSIFDLIDLVIEPAVDCFLFALSIRKGSTAPG